MGETDLDKMLNTLKPILRPGIYVYTSLRLESSRFYNTIDHRTKDQIAKYSSSPDCHVDPYRHVDQPNLEKKS